MLPYVLIIRKTFQSDSHNNHSKASTSSGTTKRSNPTITPLLNKFNNNIVLQHKAKIITTVQIHIKWEKQIIRTILKQSKTAQYAKVPVESVPSKNNFQPQQLLQSYVLILK